MAGDIGAALHHLGITDEFAEGFIVSAAGELDHTRALEALAIPRLSVAEVEAAFIGAAIGDFLQPSQPTRFMGDLGHEVGDAGGCVDLKAFQASIQIRQLGWGDIPAKHVFALGGRHQIGRGGGRWCRAKALGETFQRLLVELLLQPFPSVLLVGHAPGVTGGIRQRNHSHGAKRWLTCLLLLGYRNAAIFANLHSFCRHRKAAPYRAAVSRLTRPVLKAAWLRDHAGHGGPGPVHAFAAEQSPVRDHGLEVEDGPFTLPRRWTSVRNEQAPLLPLGPPVTFSSTFCRPHAFVVMPFGTKQATDGSSIDFNRVYAELIRPALDLAGLDPFRADQEVRAGDIRTDMFQELLLADLVLADLTIDNPNVWYELGVRHALRARGVVLISGGRVTTAFDLYTDRKVRYGLREGGPDPATLANDREVLAGVVRATMESWKGRRIINAPSTSSEGCHAVHKWGDQINTRVGCNKRRTITK